MKKCGCNTYCGCAESVVTSKPFCSGTYPYCSSEQCSESFDGKCLTYTGDPIANLSIPKGMTFNDFVQKMVLMIVNPGCNYPDSPGQSVVGFYSTKIRANSAVFKWKGLGNGYSYQIQYRKPTVADWTVNESTTDTESEIGGLDSATTYYVKVVSTNETEDSCSSVILEITTL